MEYKFDIANIYPDLYSADQKRCKLVTVPAMRALSIRGEGESEGPRFKDSLAALHGVAYALKSLPASELGIDDFVNFNVTYLECLWSMKNGTSYDPSKSEQLLWELFIVVPGFVTQKLINIAANELTKKMQNERLAEVHINTIQEKKSAQLLHLGSHETIYRDYEKLQNYIKRIGCKPSARYHEIYLNDPTSTNKSHLKTIIRQPVVKLAS
jgi:hypothetical protein